MHNIKIFFEVWWSIDEGKDKICIKLLQKALQNAKVSLVLNNAESKCSKQTLTKSQTSKYFFGSKWSNVTLKEKKVNCIIKME